MSEYVAQKQPAELWLDMVKRGEWTAELLRPKLIEVSKTVASQVAAYKQAINGS